MTAAVTPGRDELLALAEWCRTEREKLGAIDGYDYRSGEEFGLRRAQSEIEKRLAAKPANEDAREEAAYAAYLGICVLATMCKKAGLSLAEKRATELLIEMGNAFPSFAGRSALRSLSTTGEPKR